MRWNGFAHWTVVTISLLVLSGAGAAQCTRNCGFLPKLSISPRELVFADHAVGTKTVKTITLKSVGNYPVSLRQITISGAGFTETNNCPASLAPGQSCKIPVTFAPKQPGTYSGEVDINYIALHPVEARNALSGTAH